MTDPRDSSKLDRMALERVLHRAAELQAAERDIGEGLTPDEVLALGKEVGIPDHLLRQAMLEDRTRVPAPASSGLADVLAGPAEVGVARVVRGTPERAEQALLGWMDKHELLGVQRRQPGRISWEKLAGFHAAMRRGLASFEGRARFMLDRAEVVHATIAPLDEGRVHVSLGASLRHVRAGLLGGAAALGTLGVAGSAVLVALNAVWFAALGPVVLGAGVGWVVTRQLGPALARTRLGLERALDHVEEVAATPVPELPPRAGGLVDLVTGEIRRALSGGRPPRPS